MASKVIAVRGTPVVDEQFDAGEAITPGHLIDFNTDTPAEWVKHAGAGLNASPTFALERDELGKEISVAYAENDRVKAGFFNSGDVVNALVASGQTLAVGAWLESAGDGTLRAIEEDAATDDDQRNAIVGRSAEPVTALALTRHKIWVV